jgi:hypothetical protein
MNQRTENAVSFIQDLRDAAARNPVSAGLIGMGALWMLMGARSAGTADAFRRVAFDRIPDALDNVRSGLKETGGSIREAAASTLDVVRDRGTSTLNTLDEYGSAMPDPGTVLDTARENLTELFRTQPLALGAIGVAIGAGIAAALPNTTAEDAYLGEVSQTIKTKAAEIAGQQVERSTTLATEVIEAASTEARKQGLTPDGAKAAVDDITGRVGRVVNAAKNSGGEKPL